ncbi:hypothetical protein B0H11DRAFT_2282833 [Mycena galericulata]|nr:hypothetical protein B0H11DRAFT_2282833 [Mycena galericulata]
MKRKLGSSLLRKIPADKKALIHINRWDAGGILHLTLDMAEYSRLRCVRPTGISSCIHPEAGFWRGERRTALAPHIADFVRNPTCLAAPIEPSLLQSPELTSENKAMAKTGRRDRWSISLLFSLKAVRSSILLTCPDIIIIFVMQCNLLIAFVAACLAMTVSAAPVAEVAVPLITHAPELARSTLELPRVVEEAREPQPGCTLYTCICQKVTIDTMSPPTCLFLRPASLFDAHTGAFLLVLLRPIVSLSSLGIELHTAPPWAVLNAARRTDVEVVVRCRCTAGNLYY